MIIAIELAMMTRMTKRVFVEVPDDFMDRDVIDSHPTLNELMGEIYDLDEGMGYEMDDQWGCEEGTHSFVAAQVGGDDVFPDYRLNEDGTVELVEVTEAEEVLDDIRNILWPGGDKDHEWNADTVDAVSKLLIDFGYGPNGEEGDDEGESGEDQRSSPPS